MTRKGFLYFMALPKKRRDELEEIVEKFMMDHHLDMKNDIFQQLETIGFEVHKANFTQRLDGIILVNETERSIDGFGGNKLIFYKADAELYETRFIIAHELAHYISEKEVNPDKKIIIARRDHNIGYSENVNEQEMDYMAAAMLIPRTQLEDYLVKYLNSNNIHKFNQIVQDQGLCKKLKSDQYLIQCIQKTYRVEERTVTRRLDEIFNNDDN